MRRSIAWVAGAEMPYASNTAGYIEEPRYGIFICNRKILYSEKNVVIGEFTLKARAINASLGYLYVDDDLIYKGKEIILNLELKAGKHIIRFIVKNGKEEAINEIEVISI